jgi:hypothetical protein
MSLARSKFCTMQAYADYAQSNLVELAKIMYDKWLLANGFWSTGHICFTVLQYRACLAQ